MLDLKKYDTEIIEQLVQQTEQEIELSKSNEIAVKELYKLNKIDTNFDSEITKIYDKQYIRDAIKDLFIKYDFTYDIKNIVELKILGFRNFQIAERVGKGAQAVSNTLARKEVKEFFDDLFALKIADNSEKISIGNTLAINTLLDLLKSPDERIRLQASKVFIDLAKEQLPNSKQNVSVPNNAVTLDLKKIGYKTE